MRNGRFNNFFTCITNCFPKETNFPKLKEDLKLQIEKANTHARKNQYRMAISSQV